MKTKIIIVLLIIVCLFSLTLPISAHSGRTDSNGGHYDNSTGKYHYHHGYPAHNHYDMDGDGDIDCPYLYSSSQKDTIELPTVPELDTSWIDNIQNKYSYTTNSKNINHINTFKIDWEEILSTILVIIALLILVPCIIYWIYGLTAIAIECMFPNFDRNNFTSKALLVILTIVVLIVLILICDSTN